MLSGKLVPYFDAAGGSAAAFARPLQSGYCNAAVPPRYARRPTGQPFFWPLFVNFCTVPAMYLPTGPKDRLQDGKNCPVKILSRLTVYKRYVRTAVSRAELFGTENTEATHLKPKIASQSQTWSRANRPLRRLARRPDLKA
jgi:hypothetical protein